MYIWFTPDQAGFFENGSSQQDIVHQTFSEVTGGGTLILGQDQDKTKGFELVQSFSYAL